MSWLLDPNLALMGFIGLTCVIALIRTFAMPRSQAWEARVVTGIVLSIGGLTYAAAPGAAGYVATAAWLAIVLAPGLLSQQIVRSVYRRRFRRAASIARLVAVLRPRSEWRGAAAFYDALETLRAGRRDEGLAALDVIANGASALAAPARAERLAATGSWRELRNELESRPDGFELSLLPRYVRALGEIGEPVRLLAAIERAGKRLDAPAARWLRYPMLLFAFAFAGRRQRVTELLDGPLRHFDAPARALWLATAEIAAGDIDTARVRLRSSYVDADPLLARSFDKRLESPPPVAATALDEAAQRTLARLERDWVGEHRYAPEAGAHARPVVTWAIVAVLFAVYALEVAMGGATNDKTLLLLGALAPERFAHEPWRVLTAQFLHYGSVHIGANVLGLLALGGFAERSLGRTRYLVAYVLSGTLALASYVLLARLGVTASEMLIGASGNIMGIVGASAAIVAHGWWLERARAARRHLTLVVMIVLLQAAMDLTVPGTSFAAHALGAAFGFILVGPMVGMALGRVALVGGIAVVLSVAGERFASRKARHILACRDDDLAACEETCRDGAVEACEVVAQRYDTGDGVPVDKARAWSYYVLACDGDQAGACNNLGVLTDQGTGQGTVPAASWFRKACDRGDQLGCQNLARAAIDGEAGDDDTRVARAAVAKQCAAGDAVACRLRDELGR